MKSNTTTNQTIKQKKSKTVILKSSLELTLLALPGILYVLLFNYVPLFGLVLPFKNYRVDLGFFKSDWAGLRNFKYLYKSRDVLVATRNTIFYNLSFIILGVIVAVLLALMLSELTRRWVKVYQTIIFLPYFISWVVGAFVIRTFLDMDYGIINRFLIMLGKEPILWYNDPKYWPFIIVIVNIWKTMGHGAVIYYAALMGINPEYYEAAKIDGITKPKEIFYISLPLIKNVIIMMVLLQIGKILNSDFGLFYNVPMNSSLLYSTTDVVDTFVYRSMMSLGDIGMSSAATFYQSVFGFLLVITTNYVIKKIDSESSLF